jgi:hypothetical protein
MIDKSIRYFEKGGEAKPIIGVDGKEYGSVEAMQEAMRQDHARRMRETALAGGADEGFVNSDQFNQFLQENPHNAIYAAVVMDDPYGFGTSPVTSSMAKYYTDYLTDTDQLSKIRRFQEGNKDGRLGPGQIFQPFPPPTEVPTDYPLNPPTMPDLQDFEVIPGQSILDKAADAGTLIRLADGTEMRVGFFGEHSPLQQAYLNALQERRAAATPTPAPTPTPMPTPMPTPTPTPMPVNPFQRPEAPSAPTPQPVNQYSAPPVMQTGPSMTPITDFSFYQAPQQEIALTPAEVLARARNPFNRPT